MQNKYDNLEGPKKMDERDVNLILGWAIFDLRKLLLVRKQQMEKKKKSIELITEKVDFLSGMRIYHQEAAKSESYIRNCYDPRLRLYNRGWLTLVNEEYFEFGNKLMIKASSAMTQTILKTKKDPVGTSKLQIKEDKKL